MSKLSAESIAIINQTQDLIFDGFKSEKVNAGSPASTLSAISVFNDYSDELIKPVLGETGKRLKKFASRVNLQHPDLSEYLNGISKYCNNLYNDASRVMTGPKKFTEIDLLEENSNYSRIIRRLDKPKARLLNSSHDRNSERIVKKQIRNVSMKSIYSAGENCFYGRPNNFKRFSRYSKYYQTEVAGFDEKINVFKEHGMEELAHSFAKRRDILQSQITDTFGFYRLSPAEAGIILARFHGYNWNDNQNVIIVPGDFFDDYVFWAEDGKLSEEDLLAEELKNIQSVDSLKKTMLISTRFVSSPQHLVSFGFQPRMYPLTKFSAKIPDKTKAILEKAETCLELNKAPVFDYYWAVVPSVNLNHPLLHRPKDHWTIRDGNMNHVFQDSIEAAHKLDEQLVREGFLMPVILGERDGKCYFVCLWS
jgi:hypothetical protein